MSNGRVRERVFGNEGKLNTLAQIIGHHKLRWLGHVLRMPSSRLPRRALFARISPSWRKPPGGQPLTWQRDLKSVTKALANVGAVRLPGGGPRDPSDRWLHTLSDMAKNRNQWRSCCTFLADLIA